MNVPAFSEALEIMYARLPEHIRHEDSKQLHPPANVDGDAGYPLKRWLSGIGDVFGEVAVLIDRIDFTPLDDGGVVGDTSDLTDPVTANAEWLDWLSQFVGAQFKVGTSVDDKRALIATAGFRAGSKESVARAAATVLTGQKRISVYDHTTDVSAIGAASQWDVCVVTTSNQTPSPALVLQAIIDANVKPTGVKLWHRFFEATWDAMEAGNPTWATIDGKTWSQLQETGL